MQSLLITGGNLEKRKEKASAKLSNYQISKFDTLFLAGENSIGIEKIRELKKWAARKPHSSKYKAVLILSAEKLTLEAQNALLKTLEEPPKNTLIVLTAPQEGFLLPTIVSRCKIIKLKKESEIDLPKKQITQLLNYLIILLQSGVGVRIKKAENYTESREEALQFLDKLIFTLRQALLTRHSPSSHPALSLPKGLSSSQITSTIRKALKTKAMIEKNVNNRLCLENFFLDLPTLK